MALGARLEAPVVTWEQDSTGGLASGPCAAARFCHSKPSPLIRQGLAPLPCWSDLPPEAWEQHIRNIFQNVEEEASTQTAQGRRFIGNATASERRASLFKNWSISIR